VARRVQLASAGASRTRSATGRPDDGRGREPVDPTGGAPIRAPILPRVILPLAVLLICTVIGGLVVAFELARRADDAVEAGHRRALGQAIDALHAVAPELGADSPRLVQLLEQVSGVKDLRFDDNPPAADRGQQAVFDARGRLAGTFSWQPDRVTTNAFMVMLPYAAAVAFTLAGLLALAAWQLRRQGRLLAAGEVRYRKLLREEPITGLPNREQILERLDGALAERGAGQSIALAVVDLDGFRDAKDAIGNARSEEALQEIAHRLRETMPEDVVIGRGRNSQKFVLLMLAAGPSEAVAIAEMARAAIARPMWFGLAIHVTASVGVALAPSDAKTRDELVLRAGLAARAAKLRGSGLVVPFTADMEADFEERLFIKRELGRALAARDFDVHYQPIVQADGRSVVGVEALLRWNHPTRGPIGPATFIPVAEQAGLMSQLGEFVLRRAVIDALRWPSLYVAVNLSPMQVHDRRLVDLVASILAETKLPASRLELEVTEGVLIDNPDAAKERLDALRALGIKLVLDDFGSGYSSLTYLQRLPFDKLKVDRGFVAALDQSANAGVIIQAIIALGRALNMSILVEGIETEEQRVLVRLAGSDEMQGFLFSRPAPREEIDRLLAAQPAAGPRAAAPPEPAAV
jgi:diguanylate cyclase (GGDEF)-like protein